MGDTVSALVKSIDPKSKKIRLSIKELEAPAPTPASNQYINNTENVGSNLSHALAEVKINNQQKGE